MSDRLVMAYADPPYVGQSAKHYGDHPDFGGEVNHEALIARLESEYPDGWALSASSPSLRYLLPLCPETVRVMAWIKPFCAYKRNVRVAYAWEPVIVKPARRLEGAVPTRDFVAEGITLKRGLVGAKPERVCWWLFNAMGLRPTDDLHDLFVGSGAVSRAWEAWRAAGAPKLKQSVKVANDLVVADQSPERCACGLVSRGLVDGVCADCRDRRAEGQYTLAPLGGAA